LFDVSVQVVSARVILLFSLDLIRRSLGVISNQNNQELSLAKSVSYLFMEKGILPRDLTHQAPSTQ
jgi:hypothetical protein